jgi:hypothetical protein
VNRVAKDRTGSVILQVRVIPRAARDEADGWMGEALKVRLRAPPVEGRANAALARWLAKQLDIPIRRVVIESGKRSRLKRVRLEGCSVEEVARRLVRTP